MQILKPLGSLTGFILLSFALVGCGGSQMAADKDPGVVAFEFLPNVQSTEHHPDLLRDGTLSADSAEITFGRSFSSVLAKWSVRPRYKDVPSHEYRNGPGWDTIQAPEFVTGDSDESAFATLHSKEVALAQLASSHDLQALTSEEARTSISEQLIAYEDTLRLDVYFRNLSLARLRSMTVSLQNGESRTFPVLGRSYKLGAAANRGRKIDYQRMSLYFSRTVDGQDLMDSARNLRLIVTGYGGSRWEFHWGWKRSPSTATPTPADR